MDFKSIEEIEKVLNQLKEIGINNANFEMPTSTIYSVKLSEVKAILESLVIDCKSLKEMNDYPLQPLNDGNETKGKAR